MNILGYAWTEWQIASVVAVLSIALVLVIAVVWWRFRRREWVEPPPPQVAIRGHKKGTIENRLLETTQSPEPLQLRELDALHVDADFLSYMGKDWLGHVRDGTDEMSRWSVDGSGRLRARLVGEAAGVATRMTVLTDGELIPAIARDLGTASSLHALACHNLMAWVSRRSSREALAAFESSLRHCQAAPSTVADMFAQCCRTKPLARLLRHAVWLGEYLRSAPELPVEARDMARKSLESVTHRSFLTLHLFGLEWGPKDAWRRLVETDGRRTIVELWDRHVILKETIRNVTGTGPRKFYRWYVASGHGNNQRLLLDNAVRRLCPQQTMVVGHNQTNSAKLELQVAGLIARNPLDLIRRLATFPWEACGAVPASLPIGQVLDWEWLAPLLRRPYWSLHDKLADLLTRSLCRVANGEANALETHLSSSFFSQAFPVAFADPDSKPSSANVPDYELCFGARHLLICCCDQLIQRNRAGIGLGEQSNRGDESPIARLLRTFHQVRVEHHRRAGEPAIDPTEVLFRQRYAELVNSGCEAEIFQLCVTRGGAPHHGRPQPNAVRPQSQNNVAEKTGSTNAKDDTKRSKEKHPTHTQPDRKDEKGICGK